MAFSYCRVFHTQVARSFAKNEADGVHKIRLAASVRTHDALKVAKGTDAVKAPVALEVLHFQKSQQTHSKRLSCATQGEIARPIRA